MFSVQISVPSQQPLYAGTYLALAHMSLLYYHAICNILLTRDKSKYIKWIVCCSKIVYRLNIPRISNYPLNWIIRTDNSVLIHFFLFKVILKVSLIRRTDTQYELVILQDITSWSVDDGSSWTSTWFTKIWITTFWVWYQPKSSSALSFCKYSSECSCHSPHFLQQVFFIIVEFFIRRLHYVGNTRWNFICNHVIIFCPVISDYLELQYYLIRDTIYNTSTWF